MFNILPFILITTLGWIQQTPSLYSLRPPSPPYAMNNACVRELCVCLVGAPPSHDDACLKKNSLSWITNIWTALALPIRVWMKIHISTARLPSSSELEWSYHFLSTGTNVHYLRGVYAVATVVDLIWCRFKRLFLHPNNPRSTLYYLYKMLLVCVCVCARTSDSQWVVNMNKKRGEKSLWTPISVVRRCHNWKKKTFHSYG